ncbi:MAG: hypothetical protein L3J56_01765 [Bacteroidales bacterium]|nr:hypothetical protein [Bacteroidales bacterium]
MRILNFFSKNNTVKSDDIGNTEFLREKIISAIRICKQDIRTEENKISEIKKWAKELIADIYFVPSEYWYDEIKYLNEIKNHIENKNLNNSVIQKTDNLVNDYFQQINLSESKLEFLRTLLIKYGNLSDKIDNTIHKTLMLKSKNEYIKSIKKYKRKLDEVQNPDEDFSKIYEESEHLKTIKNEIKETEEDFLIQKEVNEYINKLTTEYMGNDEISESEFLKNEILRIKNELIKDRSVENK